ncbi:MAG: ATP-binding cassette domain-containing protein, partial [Solirubrobacterales bacterium]|nr:ATP-binding cassette domain-containing protein [Solirubrobacterales bacterium]
MDRDRPARHPDPEPRRPHRPGPQGLHDGGQARCRGSVTAPLRAGRRRGGGPRSRTTGHRLRAAAGGTVTATAAAPLLRSRGLSRYFGAVPALHGVDLDVLPGERRAILGPNGAGKSTLFNLIAGDLAPSEGTVELFGRDVTVLAV